jgi:hypothetical protein
VNDDGATGVDDLGILVTGLNAPGVGDLNCDGAVGVDDIAIAVTNLNQPPGPSGLGCAGTPPCSAQ